MKDAGVFAGDPPLLGKSVDLWDTSMKGIMKLVSELDDNIWTAEFIPMYLVVRPSSIKDLIESSSEAWKAPQPWKK